MDEANKEWTVLWVDAQSRSSILSEDLSPSSSVSAWRADTNPDRRPADQLLTASSLTWTGLWCFTEELSCMLWRQFCWQHPGTWMDLGHVHICIFSPLWYSIHTKHFVYTTSIRSFNKHLLLPLYCGWSIRAWENAQVWLALNQPSQTVKWSGRT